MISHYIKFPLLLILLLDHQTSLNRLVTAQFAGQCFASRDELKAAVDLYSKGTCNSGSECGQTYGWPINTWCTSNITDMSNLFYDLFTFNDDISGWNTTNVTNMDGMFHFASSFNRYIGEWDVSAVESMDKMFMGATSYNQDISGWDISSVSNLNDMFQGATSFNQNLCEWGDKFQYSSEIDDIFSNSGCTFQDKPQMFQQGPFCESDCVPTTSPTNSPTVSLLYEHCLVLIHHYILLFICSHHEISISSSLWNS